MKKIISLLIPLTISCLAAIAQVETVKTTGTITRTNASGTTTTIVKRTSNIDSNTIVKDSAGVRYAYNEWHNLIVTGKYKLMNQPTDKADEFTLVKKDALEITAMKNFRLPTDESGYIKTGNKLDLFSAKDIAGYKIRPKDLEGKVVVLNFWFIACPPCKEEIPELNKIALRYASNPNIVFIAVALDGKEDLQKFLKYNPFSYHIVDDGKEIAAKYEIKGYPTSIILDKEGKVKLHTTGYGPYTLNDFTKTIEEAVK
ncbi:TlpA disulfide reductase family protein [Mucilaginibacter xinganensis]|uniref:Peroxiredoxin n=1 Tax=Mucilaginibacter xinganensis TaxID=1234841 RepID=A0A223P4C7_9SPHI|nr:TlpA disulfide reductase family protein [Mucilaginibacter xinganensis]ASU36824.1 Peroxiredoxin [Mucilaginibacter xinganensis]